MASALRRRQLRLGDNHPPRSLFFAETSGEKVPSPRCRGGGPPGGVVDQTAMELSPPAREAVTSAVAAIRTGPKWVSTRVPSAAKLLSASGLRNVRPRPCLLARAERQLTHMPTPAGPYVAAGWAPVAFQVVTPPTSDGEATPTSVRVPS